MLTLSQLAGSGEHGAIDRTQRAILREQGYSPGTVLKHTMFTVEPGPTEHYSSTIV